MPVDTSIYSQIRQPQTEQVSPIDSMAKAMTIGHLALQNKDLQRTQEEQDAVRSAFASSQKPDGSVDTDQALSKISKAGFPMAAMTTQNMLAQQAAAKADMQNKVMQDNLTRANVFGREISALADPKISEEDRAAAYAPLIQRLKRDKIILPEQNIPDEYDRKVFNSYVGGFYNSKDHIEDSLKQAQAAKAASETKLAELAAPGTRAQTAATTAETKARTAEIIQNTGHAPTGPVTDPTQLVQTMPKEYRAQATKEIGEAKEMAATKRAFMEQWQDLNSKALAGALSPEDRQSAINTLAGRLAKIGEGRFNLEESKIQMAALMPSWKDPGGADGQTRANKLRRAELWFDSQVKAPNFETATGRKLNDFESTRTAPADPDMKLAKDIVKNGAKPSGGSGGVLESTASADSGKPAALPAPKPGDVEDGHVFLGGDPRKQSSWKKQ